LFAADRTRTLQNPTANQPNATKRQQAFFEARIDFFDDNSSAVNKGRGLFVSGTTFHKD